MEIGKRPGFQTRPPFPNTFAYFFVESFVMSCPTDFHLTRFHVDALVLYTFFGPDLSNKEYLDLAPISHELLAATTDLAAHPGVLGVGSCDVPFRYASEPISRYAGRLSGGTPI